MKKIKEFAGRWGLAALLIVGLPFLIDGVWMLGNKGYLEQEEWEDYN